MIFFWGKKKKDKGQADTAQAQPDAPEAPKGPAAPEAPPEPEALQEQAPTAASVPDHGPPVSPEAEPDAAPGTAAHIPHTPEAKETASPPHSTQAADTAPPEPEPETQPSKPGFFSRIAQGLKKSSSRLTENVTSLFTKRTLDAEALEELEEVLLTADLGMGPTARIIDALAKDKFDKEVTDAEVRAALAAEVAATLTPHERDLDLSGQTPQVVVFVGVNGSGKTTTLGKIAALIAREGRSVVLAAGDTFRAAAVEQLKVWGERAGCPVVSRETGADAAGLVFDAYAQAKAQGADALLIDTAGRLQNKAQLMDELRKIVRVLRKQDASAPHHVLLVLDATVGQNALSQVDAFREVADVTGLIMTKLDTTAKGGVLVAVADKHPDLPIYFTGVGESLEDLQPFSAQAFADALAGTAETEPA